MTVSATYWRQGGRAERGRPCLFLDRDGVLVEEVGYLHRPDAVRLIPGAAECIRAARARNYAVGLVTNQSGVGRGCYDWAAFEAVQAEIVRRLDLGPEPFDFVAACGAHADATITELRAVDHPWRKPRPGMLLAARDALELDMSTSIMVGDRLADLQAGEAAGCGRLILVRTGYGAEVKDTPTLAGGAPVMTLPSLANVPWALGWSPSEPGR